MKSLLKILLGIVALLVVITIGLAITVLVMFDPKDYQPLLARSVEEATGRRLTLAGDLGLKLFPCCSVTLGRASLGNPPGFPAGEFASVEGAALSLRVWPLITRRDVEIGTVRLDGLDANLHVRADGAANWEFETAPAAPAQAQEGGEETGRIEIRGIDIRNGRVAYRDEQSGANYVAEDILLTTADVAPGKPFDLTFSAKLTDRSDGTSGTVKLESRATLEPDESRLTLEKPAIELAASGKAIPATSLRLKLGAGELSVESKQDTKLTFRNLEGEFALPGLEAVAGDVEGSFASREVSLGAGASTEMSSPKLAADFTVSGKDIPGGTIEAQVKAEGIALDLDKMRGGVESLAAEFHGLGAKLALTGAGRIADTGADLAGSLTLDPVSPRSVLAILKEPEPQTADPQALTRLSGTADWALGKDSLRLPKLAFQLDQTQLAGSLGIAGFDKPVTSFDLTLDAIDLDRYLAPEAEGAAGGGGGAAAEEDIPVETIRDLRLDGRVRIGRLTFAKANMTDVRATLRAADGRLRLDPLSAQLYGGEYRGAVGIDATGPQARVSMEQQLTALQVGGVLKDLYQNDKLTGALSGRINATGAGNRSDDILKSLAGNVSVNLADGVYLGTDLWHEIRSARAKIRREAPPPAPAVSRTTLDALELGAGISGGVVRTDKLLAQVPFIRMTGAGALNLVDKTIDYRLQAQVFETPTFEDGTTLKDLTGLTIPLTLKGAMDQPKVGVDLAGLAAGAATQKLTERLFKKLEPKQAPPAEDTAGTAEGEAAQPAGEAAPVEEQPKEEKPRDELKRALRDLLKPKPAPTSEPQPEG